MSFRFAKRLLASASVATALVSSPLPVAAQPAQPAESAATPDPAATPDAAAAAAPGAPPPDAAPADAASRFAHATKLYKQRKYSEALPLFEELSRETNSPNALLYVGHCRVKLGQNVAAYRAFARIVGNSGTVRDDKYDTTREAARTELFALEQKVGKLVVAPAETPQGFAVTVDGEALDPAWFGLAYAVEPGAHRVQAGASGMQAETRDVELAAGETKTLSLALKTPDTAPAPPPPPKLEQKSDGYALRMAGFAALGVGVAGLAVFTVAGLGAKSVHDDLEAECPDGCDDDAHRDDISRGKTLQTTANVGLIVGVLGAAGGTTLLLLGRPSPSEASASVALSPAGGVLTYRGSF